ncbi:hypothetical protein [Streptomyces cyaneofuscatus]|uniref:hypothetical protein n=1 Tax=Streptomyces cyaneofuscatus TaxID=66883 RepID=UPI003F541EF1
MACARPTGENSLSSRHLGRLLAESTDGQVFPIDTTSHKSAKLIPNATLKVYEGGSHNPRRSPARLHPHRTFG